MTETQIIQVCQYCGIGYGTKDGHGISGVSHGICAGCLALSEKELDMLAELRRIGQAHADRERLVRIRSVVAGVLLALALIMQGLAAGGCALSALSPIKIQTAKSRCHQETVPVYFADGTVGQWVLEVCGSRGPWLRVTK